MHFTGQERDAESGNDNFKARYFGSSLGRFLSPDPGPWIFLNPQSYNAYSYGLNNPLRYVDDTGQTAEDRVKEAEKLVGVPYVTGGNNPVYGLDCSGLVENAFLADGDNNITSLNSKIQAMQQAVDLQSQGYFSTDIHKAQPGDVIFFSDPNTGRIKHAGIVIDIKNGRVYFIHAPEPGKKVNSAWVDMKTLLFGKAPVESFAGVGRPIEGASQLSNSSNANPFTSATDGLSSFLEELFFNQDFNAPAPPPPPPPAPPGEVCTQLGDQGQPCQIF